MDVSLLIKRRLGEMGLDQKDLANAAHVTESYISQLLARKKAPPAPGRTDIYEKIGEFLGLPGGELSKLAEVQRQSEFRKKVTEIPQPLYKDCRELILRKCAPEIRGEVQRIFEKESFGELERLVTWKVLEVAQGVAREELRNERWLRSVAKAGGKSYEQVRVATLEFLDSDIFQISLEGCVGFLDPAIDTWSIDLRTFAMQIGLKERPEGTKRFEFVEKIDRQTEDMEPGLKQFLNDKSLSGHVTDSELEFLRSLQVKGRRPAAIYYYRELQNLRDPLHFPG